ncbi:hypothetical protein ACFUNF_24680 [Streptomyces sp. NPDC057291]
MSTGNWSPSTSSAMRHTADHPRWRGAGPFTRSLVEADGQGAVSAYTAQM